MSKRELGKLPQTVNPELFMRDNWLHEHRVEVNSVQDESSSK